VILSLKVTLCHVQLRLSLDRSVRSLVLKRLHVGDKVRDFVLNRLISRCLVNHQRLIKKLRACFDVSLYLIKLRSYSIKILGHFAEPLIAQLLEIVNVQLHLDFED
jgi:hypothetical protein